MGAEGDSVSGDDVSSFKIESDGISSKWSATALHMAKNATCLRDKLILESAIRIHFNCKLNFNH